MDDIFKCISSNENIRAFVLFYFDDISWKRPVDIIPALVQKMTFRLEGDESSYESIVD